MITIPEKFVVTDKIYELGICPFATQVPLPSNVYTPMKGAGTIRAGFCDHTAGGYYSTLANRDFWIGQGYSVHFGIGLDGDIVQLVNIFDNAWGQGRLGPSVIWPPYRSLGGQSPNNYLISVEHEDETVLNRQWTPAMLEADLSVKKWYSDVMHEIGVEPWPYGKDSLAGHYMFDQISRANCPGSGWPRDAIWNYLSDSNIVVSVDGEGDMPYNVDTWALTNLVVKGQTVIDAIQHFNLPVGTKVVQLEFLAKNGYSIIKTTNGNQVGRIGWGWENRPSYQSAMVFLDDGGKFVLDSSENNGRIEFFVVHATCYWK